MSILVTIMKGTTVIATQLSQTTLNMLMGFAEHKSTVKVNDVGEEYVHTTELEFEYSTVVKHGDYSGALTNNIMNIWVQKMNRPANVPE